jgi:hypothetical protein
MRVHYAALGSDGTTGTVKQEVKRLLLPRERVLYRIKGMEGGCALESGLGLPATGDKFFASMLLLASGKNPYKVSASPEVVNGLSTSFGHDNMDYGNVVHWQKWGMGMSGTITLLPFVYGGEWHPLDEWVSELWVMADVVVISITQTMEWRVAVEYEQHVVSQARWVEVMAKWGMDLDPETEIVTV